MLTLYVQIRIVDKADASLVLLWRLCGNISWACILFSNCYYSFATLWSCDSVKYVFVNYVFLYNNWTFLIVYGHNNELIKGVELWICITNDLVCAICLLNFVLILQNLSVRKDYLYDYPNFRQELGKSDDSTPLLYFPC